MILHASLTLIHTLSHIATLARINTSAATTLPLTQPVLMATGKPVNSIEAILQAEENYISLSPLEHFTEILHKADIDLKTMQNNDSELKKIIDYLSSRILPSDDKLARHVILES